jgi:hypothetical protein
MGAPTLEVGYTSATAEGYDEVYMDMWWHWGGKSKWVTGSRPTEITQYPHLQRLDVASKQRNPISTDVASYLKKCF